jgi:invasion protein IalB
MKTIRASVAGAMAFALVSLGAAADPAPATGPVAPSETKVFGDWTVRCYPVKSPSPCDMFQLLAKKQTGERFMSLSVAYMPGVDKHVIQIAVPLGVAIQQGLVLQSDTYTSPVLKYRRCDRGGCYVEMLIPNDAITALASGNSGAKVKITADGGKVFNIAFSLKGFGDAHGAMTDLARKKTAGEKPAGAPAAPAPTDTAPAAPDPAAPAIPMTPTP